MTNAADLPLGSVVATGQDSFIKAPGVAYPWTQTGSHTRWTDFQITALIKDHNATVLRVGDGT